MKQMNGQRLLFWRKSPDCFILNRYDLYNQREGDTKVIQQLRKEGADLSRSREVRHYLYLPSANAASLAAKELDTCGYNVEQQSFVDRQGNRANSWLVLATIEIVVNEAHVDEATTRFTHIAMRYGGDYDGWEAAATP